MAVCQNLVPLVNIKIAGKWMFIPLKMVLIGIDPYPDLQTPGKRGRELRAVKLEVYFAMENPFCGGMSSGRIHQGTRPGGE